jgi:hypothetical protein
VLSDCKPIRGVDNTIKQQQSINNNESSTVNARLKTVNLTKSSTKTLATTTKQTSCALDSVGASTEEVYWLPATQYEYSRRTSTQTLCKTIVLLAQQENKGKSNNNQTM